MIFMFLFTFYFFFPVFNTSSFTFSLRELSPFRFFFLHFFVWQHFSCTHHFRLRLVLVHQPCLPCLKHSNKNFNLGSINFNPLSSPRRSYSSVSNSCVDETMSQVVPLSPIFSLTRLATHKGIARSFPVILRTWSAS